jgi:hypothetical protein
MTEPFLDLALVHADKRPSSSEFSGKLPAIFVRDADTRTTQLYDRRDDVASRDEYGKVGI